MAKRIDARCSCHVTNGGLSSLRGVTSTGWSPCDRPAVLAVWVASALLSACGNEPAEFEFRVPWFAPEATLPDLSATVLVTSSSGSLLAEKNLPVQNRMAKGHLPALPVGDELGVHVRWFSGERLLAELSSSPKVRVSSGHNTRLELRTHDYVFADDDQDGASNIHELAYESAAPEAGRNASTDPHRVPPGFFNGVTGHVRKTDDRDQTVLGSASALGQGLAIVSHQGGELGSLSNQTLDFVELSTRKRRHLAVECGVEAIEYVAIDPHEPHRGAITCASHAHLVSWSEEPRVIATVPPPYPGAPAEKLHFSPKEREFYVAYPHAGYVSVVDSTHGNLRTMIGPDELGNGAWPMAVARTQDKLLILDHRGSIIVFLSHGLGIYTQLGTALSGAFPSAFDLVVHPSGHRAYVTSEEDGVLHTIDIEAEDPQKWKVLSQQALGLGLQLYLSMEPATGNWLYTTDHNGLIRIDTLNNAITGRITERLVAEMPMASSEVSFSADRRAGAFSQFDAVLLLGHRSEGSREQEPNDAPDQLHAGKNIIGPGPCLVTGSADEFSTEGTINVDTVFPEPRDVEDLWVLGVGKAQTRYAMLLRLFGQSVEVPGLFLLTPQGRVMASADPTHYTDHPQTAFLLTPPTSKQDPAPLVGIDPMSVARYEVVSLPVGTVNTLDEIEPNHTVDDAHDIRAPLSTLSLDSPVLTLRGSADPTEEGAISAPLRSGGRDDLEDCFKVPVKEGLHVRLDLEPGSDLDLRITQEDGTPVTDHAAVSTLGKSEFFTFSPPFFSGESALVCVSAFDGNPASAGNYELTFFDFSFAWPLPAYSCTAPL